jgi:UrcA family protein
MAHTKKAALTLAAFAAIALVTPAHAGDRHKQVQYSDLDLSTLQGQEKFKTRVMRAVRSVCAFPSAKTAADRLDRDRCEARAKTSAMRKVGQTIARHGGNVKVALDY